MLPSSTVPPPQGTAEMVPGEGMGCLCRKQTAFALPSPGLGSSACSAPPCTQSLISVRTGSLLTAPRVFVSVGCGRRMFFVSLCYKWASERVMLWGPTFLPSVSVLIKIWFCPFYLPALLTQSVLRFSSLSNHRAMALVTFV